MLARKKMTRGRQRIPMQRIASQDDLYASFSKRRLGIFKKASELCTLCDVDIGVIVFSPTNNPFSFFSPSMDYVIERYTNPAKALRPSTMAIAAVTRARIAELNKELDQAVEEKYELKKQKSRLEEEERARPKTWWEETPINSLTKEGVGVWTKFFSEIKAELESIIQDRQLENESDQLPPSSPHQNHAEQEFVSSDFNDLGDYEVDMSQLYGSPDPLPLNNLPAGGGDELEFNMNQYLHSLSPLSLNDLAGGGDDQANMNGLYSSPTMQLNNLFGGGGGEGSSINAYSNPNYFNLQMPLVPSIMSDDGSSSSNDVFYPNEYCSSDLYVGDEILQLDPIGGGGGQYGFPAPDPPAAQGGVGEFSEQQYYLGTPDASDFYFGDPFNRLLPNETGPQDLTAAAEILNQPAAGSGIWDFSY